METNHKEFSWETFPILNTERLNLIEMNNSHLGDLFKLFGDENVTRFYNLLPLKNEQEAQETLNWYKNRFNNKLGIRWGITIKGKQNVIGTIGFNSFTKQHRANIGYDLQTAHWNNGYITEALKEVISFGFEKLEVNRIEGEVMQGNLISEKVLKKLSFKKEGD